MARRTTETAQVALPLPAFIKPQLALLVDKPPTGRNWIHEIKFDGYRGEIAVAGDRAAFYTRRGLDWTGKLRALTTAAYGLHCRSALLDGELVALDDKGISNFSKLQVAMGSGRTGGLVFFAFDLLELDGRDLKPLALLARKEALKQLLVASSCDRILYSDHITGDGQAFYRTSCTHGLEGIVSKPGSEAYRPGRRDRWMKTKCAKRQEFVVGGWQAREGDERDLASLLLGFYEGGKLHFAGKVGTGFDTKTRQQLIRSLTTIKRDTDPFVETPREYRKLARWAEPRMVVEVQYAEFTNDGILRHTTFKGIREDKRAEDVHLEVPRPMPAPGVIAGAKSRWRKTFRR
jgi:bifunctional non-homologous end joining protein LigD